MLIVAGVAGIGVLVDRAPWAVEVVRWLGVAFLTVYGVASLQRARRARALDAGDGVVEARRGVVGRAVALTWLNPHVYLDTVFLLGSVAADRGPLRWTFGLGAVLASLCWFAALGFGARLLSRYLAKPTAWRVLDGLVAATMVALGATLVAGA